MNEIQLSGTDIEKVLGVVTPAAPPSDGSRQGPLITRAFEIFKRSETTSGDILNALDDMALPEDVLNELQSFFTKSGFELVRAQVTDPYNLTKVRSYTAARKSDFELALLHLPGWILGTTDSIGFLTQAIQNISNMHGRIVSKDCNGTAVGYRTFLKSMSQRRENDWVFIPWDSLQELVARKSALPQVFELPEIPVGAPQELVLSAADRESIRNIFARKAAAGPLDSFDFFENIVKASDWPEAFRLEIAGSWKSQALADAQKLLDFVMGLKRFSADHDKHGDTVIGWLLVDQLEKLGNPDNATFADIIVRNQLVSQPAALAKANKILEAKGG